MYQPQSTSFKGNKSYLPSKLCVQCGREVTWRKLRAKNCSEIKTRQEACPYTTLYWNFPIKQLPFPRTALMAKNVTRMQADELSARQAYAQLQLHKLDE